MATAAMNPAGPRPAILLTGATGCIGGRLLATLEARGYPVRCMICPSWVRTPTQPIALADLVAYLVAVLDRPHGDSRVFDVGGADVVSYGRIMQEYARQREFRRWLIPVLLLARAVHGSRRSVQGVAPEHRPAGGSGGIFRGSAVGGVGSRQRWRGTDP